MKLLTLIFCFGLVFSAYAQNYPFASEDEPSGIPLGFTASLKLANHISLSRGFESRSTGTTSPFAVGLEFYPIRDGDERIAGIGAEYQFPVEVYGIGGSFQNTSVYLLYDRSLVSIKSLSIPNIHIQLGGNITRLINGFPGPSAKSTVGLYYGFGFSMKILKHIYARIIYTSSQAGIDYNEGKHLFENNKFALSIVVR